jgi:hypothetical protein
MITYIHEQLETLEDERPCLVFSFTALRGFLLNNFKNAKSTLLDVSVPFEGIPTLSLRFSHLSVSPDQFVLILEEADAEMAFHIDTEFEATIIVHETNNPAVVYSSIILTISNFRSKLAVNAPDLILRTPEFNITGKIIESANRFDNITASGINEDELQRVEGAVCYVMPSRFALSLFSTITKINIAQLFTAFELKGIWNLTKIDNFLIIIPSEGIMIRENNGCPQRDSVPDLSVETGPYVINGNSYTWPTNYYGVQAVDVYGVNDQTDGFASIYLPKSVLEEKFSKVMPSVSYRDLGEGFIGYDLTLLVAFEYVALTIDPIRFGLVLDLDFYASGFANVNIDVPCVGRCDLANARFLGQKSRLSIFINFVLSPVGKLTIQSQIDQLTLGKIEVTISGISKWAGLAGGEAAVIGFIVDNLLKRAAERILPIKMKDAIKAAVNSKNFELLNLESLEFYTQYENFNEVCYSGDAKSVLIGLNSNG